MILSLAPLAAGLAAALVTAPAGGRPDDVPYSVPAQPWPEEFGKHRARIFVDAKADAVRVHLPWRRRDRDADRKQILVVDAATGRTVDNVARISITREAGDLAFQPATAPGEYLIYYLPYRVQDGWGGYGGDYLPVQSKADPAWLERSGLAPAQLAGGKWRDLPAAKVLEFQARTEFSRFDPMEVVATDAEVQALLAAHPGSPYLLFPEDRRRPIRMPDDLPLSWVRSGPSSSFEGEACRNEWYAFQVGLYAAGQEVRDVAIAFEGLRGPGGRQIPASAFRCINLGGTNWDGKPLRKEVSVGKGRVQALWCGVQVPHDAPAGEYRGGLVVKAANAPETRVALSLKVLPKVLEDCGDGELWRMSRLRWLDSTIAIDDEVVKPYTPLRVQGSAVRCLGREVRFGPAGLPASIRSGAHEILAAPMAFVVETDAGPAPMAGGPARVTQRAPGAVTWESAGKAGALDTRCRARMEFDGHLQFDVTLRAEKSTPVKDIRLEIPFRREVATYLMGIGRKGGYRPADWSWKWGGPVYYDSFWMGDVAAGMQVELRGASYCGPMVNLYWSLGQLQPPAAWNNGGKGGVTVSEAGQQVVVRAFGGPRTLEAGQEMTFEFALLVTPVKPLDTASHFRTRYYHAYEPVEKIAAAGANVINIHHANELNPYINYPFLATQKMHDYVKAAHARGMKVKIYYTLRELTNHVAEMWALRSLGHEVLAPGGGGGYPWLREHLGSDYAPSWYQQQPDGEACASIVNSGMSRWYNYYLEGLAWLLKNVEIDGLYNDDVSYDRQIMKRVRKIMERTRPGCMIDLHSNTAFSKGPANQYMEFFPYVDRLWFGESFDYDESPDYWLTEISGIPYGVMGEMLQNGGNPWRGMLYGMTARMPWSGNPGPMWKAWDAFGIDKAKMAGYWEPNCPVRTGRPDVLATAYVRKGLRARAQMGKTLISVASWAKAPVRVKLQVDWKALGLDPAKAHLFAPAIQEFQDAALFGPDDAIPIVPGRGWLLIADEEKHDAPAYKAPDDRAYATRKLLLADVFSTLDPAWAVKLSRESGTALEAKGGKIAIHAHAHTCAFAERALPPGVTLAQCRVAVGTDKGESWGAGLGLAWPEGFLRVNVRVTEGRLGVDNGKEQWLFPSPVPLDGECWLRLRIEADRVFAEASADGQWWMPVHSVPRAGLAGDPIAVRVGKMSGAGTNQDAGLSSPEGECVVSDLKAYGPAR